MKPITWKICPVDNVLFLCDQLQPPVMYDLANGQKVLLPGKPIDLVIKGRRLTYHTIDSIAFSIRAHLVAGLYSSPQDVALQDVALYSLGMYWLGKLIGTKRLRRYLVEKARLVLTGE